MDTETEKDEDYFGGNLTMRTLRE